MNPELIRPEQYVYSARLMQRSDGRDPVYDGDTVWLEVLIESDVGFGIRNSTFFRLGPCRLLGIDTPEMRGAEREQGTVSRDFVRSVLRELEWFTVRTHRDSKGKYGRYLVEIFLPDGSSLNDTLVEQGLAERRVY